VRAREFVIEKKRRKRRPRWAAYGPGPYGGYGYYAGYSGDGGGGDGGVGEASYPGNVGAMEITKFFRIAGPKEKDLLKVLIQRKDYSRAWALIQGITGVKLQGREFQTDEGWRDTLAGLALGTGVAMGSPADAKTNVERVVVSPGQTVYSIAKAFDTTPEVIQKLNKLDKDFTIKPDQVIKVPKIDTVEIPSKEKKSIDSKKSVEKKDEKKSEKKIDTSKTLTGKPFEALLTRTARSSGITDPIELAAFLAQTSVETGRFKHMREVGNKERIERMYDLKFNRQGAKILGNTKPGDGWRYRGRGFIQLTGRDNYTRAGRDLGLDLAKDPDLVAREPEVAARASVWYWKTHVRPQVNDFRDTAAVTKAVQGGSSALDRREREFQNFKQLQLAKI